MLLRTAVRRSLKDVRHVHPVPPRRARGEVATLYRQVERDFGVLAPPVALLSPAPECAAATWTALRESLLVPGRTARPDREAVATAVSRDNACPYCVEVHGATLGSLGPVGGDSRVRLGADPPERAELGAVVLTFQHINRLVNVFLPESPLPAFAPGFARKSLRRATGAVIAARSGHPVPGASLPLLPERTRRGPVPDDLGWAAGDPRILRALTRTAATIDAAGDRALPDTVRALLRRHLQEQGTGSAGVSRAWVEEPVSELPPPDRPLGRLALLTARASYQVGDDTVTECRNAGADDPTLVRAVCWAAMTAARHATRAMLDEGPTS
ncbi:carboxymuconolactone decarboxylase family protein [Nocardiopsis quinghaiensis]|uniref:carboxymuconolactone decarboxylase family protein n=1 Tax=Nocardiopsis quinghaiensis TaxID=464995 RepID=UPI00123B49C9|nr:carboxymuconolactone decarboxylase family protein [Nocardiopsis quinghaiensis]